MRSPKVLHIRYMTLLEVIIALSLTLILLSVLSYFYRDIDLLNTKMEDNQKIAFKKMYVENRLSDILTRTVSPDTNKKDFYFFTSSDANALLKAGQPCLVFTYNRGNDLDTPFSNHCLGRLFIDSEDNFCLATWPSPKRVIKKSPDQIPMKKEILMENVDKLSFSFYVPPEKNRSQLKPNSSAAKSNLDKEPKDIWLDDWKRDYKELPAIIKVIIQKKEIGETVFSFPLPNSRFPIVYDH